MVQNVQVSTNYLLVEVIIGVCAIFLPMKSFLTLFLTFPSTKNKQITWDLVHLGL